MKLSSAALCLLAAGALTAADPGLTQIRNVYLLPMSSSLDQYLANRLTASGRYQVVTDPAQADAIFTDRLGSDFEDKLQELYPPPPKPEEEAKKEEKDEKTEEKSMVSALGEASEKLGKRTSSFSRGKGNIFLVERNSKRVLWSTYLRSRSSMPDELNRTAGEIVSRLDDAALRRVKEIEKELKKQPPAPPASPAPAPASPAPSSDKTPPAAK